MGQFKFRRYRIALSRVYSLTLLFVLLFSTQPIVQQALVREYLYWAGFALIILCAFGRLWCLQYLTGFKTRKVVDCGPFSIVRNPLYIFSFIGAVGICLVANNVLFTVLMIVAYIFYYPFVVINEEKHLRRDLGSDFEEYCSKVNRFLPSFKNFNEPKEYTIRASKFSKAYLDVVWFPIGFMLLSILLELKINGMIPDLF
jgi:protein-S-isoprenylcysteine O-methyltransferase Ste14